MLQYLNRYAVRNNNNSVDGRKYLIARNAYPDLSTAWFIIIILFIPYGELNNLCMDHATIPEPPRGTE